MLLRRRHACLWLGAAGPLRVGAEPNFKLRLPRSPKGEEGQRAYPTYLLQRALQASGVRPQLVLSQQPMNQARSLLEVGRAEGPIDAAWTMTSAALERELLPVRVPLFKGLYGWRVLLVRKGDSDRFAGVRSLQDLRAFTLAQGSAWPDTTILRHNGLKVLGVTQFGSLFEHLEAGRADAIPRSVAEVGSELARYGDRCDLEPALLLHYPTAIYFFVHPHNRPLAERLEMGLTKLHASGAFDEAFQRQVGPRLDQLGLSKRQVIALENPLLPAQTPLARKAWWFRPV